MMRILTPWTFLLLLFALPICAPTVFAQSVEPERPPVPEIFTPEFAARMTPDERVRQYLTVSRILWKSETGITQEELLQEKPLGQTSTAQMREGFTMEKPDEAESAILLDFGREIHGGIRLEARGLTPSGGSVGKTVRVRVRFGESADEAMSVVGEKGAVNEHSIRDMIISVPWLGAVEFGESAFRFARLDLVDTGSVIHFDSVRAVFTYRDLPWIGRFQCSDERLNAIWRTAAWTQFLTMQGFIFEGAKRDRLVWYGDFHPQAASTLALFGAPTVLRDTLGRCAETLWPLPKWMNNMPNYSLWWLISVSDLYRWTGDLDYLRAREDYLRGLFEQLKPCVQESGEAGFPNPFLDWPTAGNRPALDAGTHAMFALAFDRIAEMTAALGDEAAAAEAKELAVRVRAFTPDHADNKQAAALMAIAGIENPDRPNTPVVAKNGGEGFSTFYGYYMLEALALGGEKQLALDVIRQYWGAMIDVGATTFWEDFDLKWLEGSGRIDELTPEGKKSLHGDHGAYCYVGFRHSLCHGWSSGPAAWLPAHILGLTPLEPGFKTAAIRPFLGDLDWAEGTVPTPAGPIFIRHEKRSDGTIQTTVKKPDSVQICP